MCTEPSQKAPASIWLALGSAFALWLSVAAGIPFLLRLCLPPFGADSNGMSTRATEWHGIILELNGRLWDTSGTGVQALILFAPLVLMPLAEPLRRLSRPNVVERRMELCATLLLAGSLMIEPTVAVALGRNHLPLSLTLAMPWMCMRVLGLLSLFREWCLLRPLSARDVFIGAAEIFAAIGGLLLMLSRAQDLGDGWGMPERHLLLERGAVFLLHLGFTLPLFFGSLASAPRQAVLNTTLLLLLSTASCLLLLTLAQRDRLFFAIPAILILPFAGSTALHLWIGMKTADFPRSSRILFVASGMSGMAAVGIIFFFTLPRALAHAGQYWALEAVWWGVPSAMLVLGFELCGILAWRDARS